MSIPQFLKIAPLLPASTSIMLRGAHGIGKSELGRQLAWIIGDILFERKVIASPEDYVFIDRRLSQQTEGDIIGLPSTDGEMTRFNPPDWYRKACEKPCFLCLDELNRATPEVMQAAFQIVLDRELNGWKLHPETRILTGINVSAAYIVNEIDPALLDRFWAIELNVTTKDWLTWAGSAPHRLDTKHAGMPTHIDPEVANFIANNDKWLDPVANASPQSVEPSRRSWDRLNQALYRSGLLPEPAKPEFYSVCTGYIGTEATIAFVAYMKDANKRVSGKELVEDYDKSKHKVDRMGPEGKNAAIELIVKYIFDEVKGGLNDKQGKNVADFMRSLPGELKISFWAKLSAHGTDRIDLAKSVHKHCVDMILDVFGVPRGEAGIGVIPNIPGIFKKEPTK